MNVSDGDLENALRTLPIDFLRDLVEERQLGVSSNSSEPFIEALVDESWTPKEYQSLIDTIEAKNREEGPVGYYLCNIKSISGLDNPDSAKRVGETLQQTAAEFDNQGELVKPGFQIHKSTDKVLNGTYWTRSTEPYLDDLGKVRTNERIYGTKFIINLVSNKLFIVRSVYSKVKELRAELEDFGFVFDNIEQKYRNRNKSNKQISQFVENLGKELQRVGDDEQYELGDFND